MESVGLAQNGRAAVELAVQLKPVINSEHWEEFYDVNQRKKRFLG